MIALTDTHTHTHTHTLHMPCVLPHVASTAMCDLASDGARC